MRRWMAIFVVVTCISGLAWYWFRSDPDVAAARELQVRLAALGENASWNDRRALLEQMRGHMEKLTDEQRRALFQEMRAPFENRMRAMVDGYFAAPEVQRRAYLDQQIKQMEQRRAEMQQRFAQRQADGNDRGPGRNGFPDRPSRGDAQGNRNGGPGGGRERAMLDKTTPVERARTTEFFSAMDKRRKELGLPETPFGRR